MKKQYWIIFFLAVAVAVVVLAYASPEAVDDGTTDPGETPDIYPGNTLGSYSGGTLVDENNGTINNSEGGTTNNYDGGTTNNYDGGQIGLLTGGGGGGNVEGDPVNNAPPGGCEPTVTIDSSDNTGSKKDIFQPGEPVYVTGSGYPPTQAPIFIHVVYDTTWTNGMVIPARVPGTNEFALGSPELNGDLFTPIWSASEIGKYDIVVDMGGDGIYNECIDPLDDMQVDGAGFETIPEFSTIAIPVASILGLLFLFNHRKRRKED